ncbi:prepilin peptidase [Yoonia litorea]|nr:prepilin peptidase [Yoonia litorea]
MTAEAAIWFLPAVLPITLYIAWNDMRAMKITNRSVIVLALPFVILGPFAFGLEMYLWQWLHFPVMLAIGMLFWAAGAMGGGDAKMIAVMAPYFVLGDLTLVMIIFALVLVASLAVHSLFRFTGLRNFAPEWKSWHAGRYFPKGLPLGMTLTFYLALAVFD